MLILHTSDWHLGRIFHGLHMTEEQTSVLRQLVDLAVDRKVDAVLIAGDIYDRAVPPTQAVSLLDETLSCLIKKHNIPVILIAGNHDKLIERASFIAHAVENMTNFKLVYLSGTTYEYIAENLKHYKIYGSPFCHKFGNW